jgi:hypothetical protein
MQPFETMREKWRMTMDLAYAKGLDVLSAAYLGEMFRSEL